MKSDVLLNIAATMAHSRANGPGLRAVVWVQGCTIGCPGCYNAFTHPHEQSSLTSPEHVANWVASLEGIEGVSFSGGEPFEQARAVLSTIRAIRKLSPNLTFFSYSGYDLHILQASEDPHVLDLLAELDMLSAGPYVHEKRSPELLWRGSSNQRLHYLTDAYSSENETHWRTNSPVEEFTLSDGSIQFSGFGGPGSKILRMLSSKL